jgi:hypothetical protein
MIDVTRASLTEELLRWTYALCLVELRTLAATAAVLAGAGAFGVGIRCLLRTRELGLRPGRRAQAAVAGWAASG